MQSTYGQVVRRLIALRTAAAVLVASLTCACGAPPPIAAPALTPPPPTSSPTAPASPTGSPTAETPNPALPTPPAGAVVINNIEESTSSWNWCSDCAGGLNNTTDYWTGALRTWPAMDGSSREFYVGGPPWTAALFYHRLGQYQTATHFLWDFYFYVDEASLPNVWTLEFDLYQAINGWEYMVGTHCIFGSTDEGQYWEGWNQAEGHWVKLNVPCSRKLLPPNQWHHVQWMMETMPGSHSYKYDTLIVDGTVYDINLVQPAGPIDWADVMGVQWQIDTNSNGGSVHEWVDKARVTIW